MCLKGLSELSQSLSFRLTLLYGGLFALSSLIAVTVFYYSIAGYHQNLVDDEFREELQEISDLMDSEGIDGVREEIEDETPEEALYIFLRVLNTDGSEVVSTDLSSWGHLDISLIHLNALNNGRRLVLETCTIPEKPYPVRMGYANIGQGFILHGGLVLKTKTEIGNALKKIFGIALAAVVLIAGLIGWLLARQTLSGIEEVSETARLISRGEFNRRVPLKNRGREIEHLAGLFNTMLDTIQKVITEMKEVNDNIAHDLKSPIARIRGTAEVTLTTSSSVDEYQKMAASTIEECDDLLETVNTMLDIAETKAGSSDYAFSMMDMANLVSDVCELFLPIAEKKNLTLNVMVPETCNICADFKMIRRLLANLLDNAIKFTPERGKVEVFLHCENHQTLLTVSDTGVGISETDLPLIFRRFYRCDQSRSRAGAGLGLSLVKAIAEHHHGRVDVESVPDRGSTLTVTLPNTVHC